MRLRSVFCMSRCPLMTHLRHGRSKLAAIHNSSPLGLFIRGRRLIFLAQALLHNKTHQLYNKNERPTMIELTYWILLKPRTEKLYFAPLTARHWHREV